MHDETDETIARIAAALRPLPDVDPEQTARVLVAVAAERERARARRVSAVRRWRVMGALGTVAAAGLVAAIWLREARPAADLADGTGASPTPSPATVSGSVEARLARDAKGAGLKSVQVVLRAP
ncbi:MAG TPA: hypothetical protein VFS59_01185, partial [Gemmatimonadaceae bacterium]|nr:hypothetical protein [Gemmatimonadaceae bacterium]